nr:MAG TPA: hypothetical protein [Caudoviricetes sp.]
MVFICDWIRIDIFGYSWRDLQSILGWFRL